MSAEVGFYPPDEDTFLLEDALVLDTPGKAPRVVVEVGCGSGYISAVLRRLYPRAYVLGTDINPHATEHTGSSLSQRNGDALRTSIITGIRQPIDLAVFNPPYLPSGPLPALSHWIDRSWAGGARGMEVTAKFLEETKDVPLRYLLLCSLNDPHAVISSLNDYAVNIIREKKVLGEHLLVLRIAKLG